MLRNRKAHPRQEGARTRHQVAREQGRGDIVNEKEEKHDITVTLSCCVVIVLFKFSLCLHTLMLNYDGQYFETALKKTEQKFCSWLTNAKSIIIMQVQYGQNLSGNIYTNKRVISCSLHTWVAHSSLAHKV